MRTVEFAATAVCSKAALTSVKARYMRFSVDESRCNTGVTLEQHAYSRVRNY